MLTSLIKMSEIINILNFYCLRLSYKATFAHLGILHTYAKTDLKIKVWQGL